MVRASRNAPVWLAVLLALGTTASLPAEASKPVDWPKKLESGYRELSLGNVDKAIDMFQDKVKHHPESAACHTALGTALKRKGKLLEAKAEFQQATQVETDYPDGFYEYGAMLENDKQYSAAAQAFQRYLELQPNSSRKDAVSERLRFCKEHMN